MQTDGILALSIFIPNGFNDTTKGLLDITGGKTISKMDGTLLEVTNETTESDIFEYANDCERISHFPIIMIFLEHILNHGNLLS